MVARDDIAETSRARPPCGTNKGLWKGARPGDRAALVAVLLFVLALALTPHLRLSAAVGRVAFFQMGFDEDTYIVYMVSNYFEIGRALSHYALTSLFALTGHSVDWTMILADAIFPGATAVAAYYLASQLTRSWQIRLFLALALIFGQDLLSLANVAVWNGPAWLLRFRGLFGETLVPDATTSYLTILRTPEPQFSYSIVFVLLGLLLKVGRSEGVPSIPSLVATACLSLLLPFTYTYISFPALLAAGWITLVCLIVGRRDVALRLCGIVAVACAAFASVTLAKGGGLPIFSSRLPILTPALLVCALLVVPMTCWTLLRCRDDRVAWFAIGFLLIPLVVSNQQIVTGITISARDWERNVNYQFLILGVALFGSCLPVPSARRVRNFRWSAACLALAVAFVIWQANNRAIGFWQASNTSSTFATIQAIEAARKDHPDVDRVLVHEANLVPLLAVRTGNKLDFVLDIAKLYMPGGPCCLPIPAGGIPPRSPVETTLFEFWWRTGTTPEQAQQIVMKEAQQRGGFFLGFLYNTNDAYAAATDGRHSRQDEIIRDIPRVMQRYERYLESGHIADGGRRVLVLIQKPPSEFSPSGLKSRLVATGRAASTTVYAYLQEAE